MVVFPRRDKSDVAINPDHIVALLVAYDPEARAEDPTQTVIHMAVPHGFNGSSSPMSYVVDVPMADVLAHYLP